MPYIAVIALQSVCLCG